MSRQRSKSNRSGQETGDLVPVEGPSLPDISDLSGRLRFASKEGRIWLDDQRMMLLHLKAFSAMREELIGALGTQDARAVLMRMGYTSGAHDARLARRVRPSASLFEAFSVGPQLHALEGIVQVEPVHVELEPERGHFFGEFLWYDSIEDDAHLGLYGVGNEPACWMQIGYASGYTSEFVGKPIIYREVECRAMGASYCRIIGKPVEDWDDAEDELRIFQVDRLRELSPEGQLEQGQMIGSSSGFIAAYHKLEQVAKANTTVLFLGETGVGKERFARMLHERSPRANEPFVAVNCSAIPGELVESELFGVEEGAYTGATRTRTGRFERANGGTLFLDEIGTMPLQAQTKLLRALQEREIERVGGCETRPVDVRVVAATNVDLREEVEAGNFRADLFYRLSVFPIRIPALRERRDDIPRLVEHFVVRFSAIHGKAVPGFTERAIEAILDYDYPGNIRELENMIERGVILSTGNHPLDVSHLFDAGVGLEPSFLAVSAGGALQRAEARASTKAGTIEDVVEQALETGASFEELETQLIEAAVAKADGNLSLAAKRLGLTRPQLAYRLKKARSED